MDDERKAHLSDMVSWVEVFQVTLQWYNNNTINGMAPSCKEIMFSVIEYRSNICELQTSSEAASSK